MISFLNTSYLIRDDNYPLKADFFFIISRSWHKLLCYYKQTGFVIPRQWRELVRYREKTELCRNRLGKIKSCAFTRKHHQNEISRLPYRLQTAVKGCCLHYWTRDFKFCVVTGIAKVRSKSTLRFMFRSSLTAQLLDDHGSVVSDHSNHITEEEDPSKLRCRRWNTFRSPFFCSSSESFFPRLGEQVAVFRAENGKAHVVDAYCPHLGANLAVGGRVLGNCIECPFHGWQFQGSDGKCVKIPYAEKGEYCALNT